MLILERKHHESITITSPMGEEIEIQILDTTRNKAKVSIEAPDDFLILRNELMDE